MQPPHALFTTPPTATTLKTEKSVSDVPASGSPSARPSLSRDSLTPSRTSTPSSSSSSSSSWDGTVQSSALTIAVVQRAAMKRISKWLVFWGLLGLVLMVVQLEVRWHVYRGRVSVAGTALKAATTAATVMLLVALGGYYRRQARLLRARGTLMDGEAFWGSPLSRRFVVEFVLLCFHVPPFLDFNTREGSYHPLLPDEVGVFMFVRFYLVIRMVRDNSPLTSSGGLLLGALADVEITWSFIMKTLLEKQPKRWLAGSVIVSLLSCSYMVHVFERQSNCLQERFLDSMWLIVVTMLTIGYGDVVSKTALGRILTFFGALIGVSLTALMFAIVHRNAQLSSVELRVTTFFANEERHQANVNMAARCLQAVLRHATARRRGNPKEIRATLHAMHERSKEWASLRRTNKPELREPRSLLINTIFSRASTIYDRRVEVEQRLERILAALDSRPRLRQALRDPVAFRFAQENPDVLPVVREANVVTAGAENLLGRLDSFRGSVEQALHRNEGLRDAVDALSEKIADRLTMQANAKAGLASTTTAQLKHPKNWPSGHDRSTFFK